MWEQHFTMVHGIDFLKWRFGSELTQNPKAI